MFKEIQQENSDLEILLKQPVPLASLKLNLTGADGKTTALTADLEGAELDTVNYHLDVSKLTAGKYDEIGKIENILEDNGAIRAFMTGSGPTVFAIFDDKNKAEAALKEVEKSRLAPELFLSGPINPEE